MVDGWAEAYRYGREHLDGRLPWAALFDDAIHYAEAGFPVTPSQAAWTRRRIGPDSGPLILDGPGTRVTSDPSKVTASSPVPAS